MASDMMEFDLSTHISNAQAWEDYHRDMLLHWMQRRREFERQIPDDDAVADMLQIAEDAWTQQSQT